MLARIKIYHEHELKQGVELVLDELNLRIQCHMHDTSSHFSSMVNNIGPSLVRMEPQRKLDF
jgi:hypothetical protein